MGTEVAPVVDLGALSQSELVALAAASPYAIDRRRGRRDADLLPPPKIDRAVFNESAGSRKQTFSRHRFATNLSHNLTPSTASSATAAPTEADSENRLILFHLQRLFARDDPSYPPPPSIPLQQQTLTAPTIALPAPPEPSPPIPDPDQELMNPKGLAVDLGRLAELVGPYGEEIRRRTEGLSLESELLGFMNGLEGQWGSRRRRRKFVDAAVFGDHLPRGWKLILGIKRKERVAWINCRRYVSPRGHQFATCKEVSNYFMSPGYLGTKPTTVQSNNVGVHELSADNSVGLNQQTDSTEEKRNALPATSVTLSIHSGDSQGHRQKSYKGETQIGVARKECKKCNLTFQDQSGYVQHQLSFHQRKAKRRRVNKPVEMGVGKDGKLETQECQRASEDKHGYFGRGVADIRNHGQSPAELFDGASSEKLDAQPSSCPVSCGLQEMTVLPEQDEEPAAGEPFSVHHKDLLQEITGLPEQEKGTSGGELFSGHHHKEPVDNFSNHEIHDGACHIAEKSPTFDVASKLSTCKSAEVHEHASSEDLDFPSADCSESSKRRDGTCIIPQEVPPTTDAPGESKHADDPMDCTVMTQLKQVAELCDLPGRKFSSFPGETNFNDQVENNTLSANLDEPDLNSIAMEVDDGKIACKFAGVVNPTISEYDKPVEDHIDCGAKNDEINSDVRIMDVNLNSCLDTMPSPVSGTKCESSDVLEDGNRSPIIVQCFNASSDDNVCQDESFVNQNNVCKPENLGSQNNDMVYQSNLTMNPISPQISVDYFTSCSLTSEIKNNGNRCDDNAKEQFVNSQNISSNGAGFDAEAYNNDIFNGAITESSLAQLNNAMNMKTDFSSCYSISDLNTLTGGTANDAIDFHGMGSSFVSGSTSHNEPNEHCTLDFDIKGSMLEALERSDSDLENQYNGGDPACDSLPAAGTSGNVDDFMSMHSNFGSLTSLVRAVEGGPMSRMIQDQCDLQLGFGGQKQQIYPSFEEHLRMASAGAPQFGIMDRPNPVPVPEPTLMLGYEPTLMLGYAPQFGSCPPQLGWGDLSKMVGVLQSVCVWCNTRFQHLCTAEQQADSVGFICPSCKDKTSGHLSILNNGSSL